MAWGQTPPGNNLGSQQTPAGSVLPLVTQLTSSLLFLFNWSLHVETHLGPEGTRFEQNAQAS